MKALSWIIALAGVWELVSPFILGFSTVTAGLWDNVVVGVILIVLGVWAALVHNVGTAKVLNWIAALFGLWLVVSSFVLGTSAFTTVLYDNIIVDVIALVFGVLAALTADRVTA